MQSAIISDASCLILLDKIGELNILRRLFGTVLTTTEIAIEYGNTLPDWVIVKETSNKTYQAIIAASVDSGEASAIALAIDYDESLLIIDDLKARKFATQLGLDITGTMGVLIEAKASGVIPAVKPILEKIKRTNFRLSKTLESFVLTAVGEE
ncbi:MAG: DUF3368 domain-containing protein [Bacteroidota bacterium]